MDDSFILDNEEIPYELFSGEGFVVNSASRCHWVEKDFEGFHYHILCKYDGDEFETFIQSNMKIHLAILISLIEWAIYGDTEKELTYPDLNYFTDPNFINITEYEGAIAFIFSFQKESDYLRRSYSDQTTVKNESEVTEQIIRLLSDEKLRKSQLEFMGIKKKELHPQVELEFSKELIPYMIENSDVCYSELLEKLFKERIDLKKLQIKFLMEN